MRSFALVHRELDLPLVRAGVALGPCTAISVGPPYEVNGVLFSARAAGATRAIQLWDTALDGTDYLAAATALAAVVRGAAGELTATPTLVLAGDRGRGAVGPAVAERLQLPLLGQVLALDPDPQRVMARRRFRATIKLYAAAPPAVVCLLLEGKAAQRASQHDTETAGEIEVWSLARVGLSAAELTYRRRFLAQPSPGPERAPLRLPDAKSLAERLRADGLLAAPAPDKR